MTLWLFCQTLQLLCESRSVGMIIFSSWLSIIKSEKSGWCDTCGGICTKQTCFSHIWKTKCVGQDICAALQCFFIMLFCSFRLHPKRSAASVIWIFNCLYCTFDNMLINCAAALMSYGKSCVKCSNCVVEQTQVFRLTTYVILKALQESNHFRNLWIQCFTCIIYESISIYREKVKRNKKMGLCQHISVATSSLILIKQCVLMFLQSALSMHSSVCV